MKAKAAAQTRSMVPVWALAVVVAVISLLVILPH
jgi:hypothetical protein